MSQTALALRQNMWGTSMYGAFSDAQRANDYRRNFFQLERAIQEDYAQSGSCSYIDSILENHGIRSAAGDFTCLEIGVLFTLNFSIRINESLDPVLKPCSRFPIALNEYGRLRYPDLYYPDSFETIPWEDGGRIMVQHPEGLIFKYANQIKNALAPKRTQTVSASASGMIPIEWPDPVPDRSAEPAPTAAAAPSGFPEDALRGQVHPEAEQLRQKAQQEAELTRQKAQQEVELTRQKAQQEAEQLRQKAQQEAEQLRLEAQREAEQLRQKAQQEAEQLRQKAQQEAAQLHTDALQNAARIRQSAEAEASSMRAQLSDELAAAERKRTDLQDQLSSINAEAVQRVNDLVRTQLVDRRTQLRSQWSAEDALDAQKDHDASAALDRSKHEFCTQVDQLKTTWRKDLEEVIRRMESSQQQLEASLRTTKSSLYHYELAPLADCYAQLYTLLQGRAISNLQVQLSGSSPDPDTLRRNLDTLLKSLETYQRRLGKALNRLGMYEISPAAGTPYDDVSHSPVDGQEPDDPSRAVVAQCICPGLYLHPEGDPDNGTILIRAIVRLKNTEE